MGNFKELDVWKKAKNLAVEIYKMTESDSFKKDFSLRDQIRRAAVSIPSNIAEGDERFSNKEAIRCFYIANGSIAELITQLLICRDIGYLHESEVNTFLSELERLSKMIKTLIKYRVSNEGK
ncbi:four helix bundle protein [Hippea alviniae]|uniref:four helix bundle protein n=1 Tax=Hippea alviniae TaxID=1279027 RepID=UPI0003B4E5EA|nr:four helix bundle protein [Hippea alviniae]